MRNRRANCLLAAMLGGLLVFQAGCIGHFRLTSSLLTWNQQLSNKWVNELVFFGLATIPVYAFSLMGDAFIFNTIEFWGGTNPISSTVEGGDAVASTRTFEQGQHKVVLERIDTEAGRQLTVRTYRNDRLVERSDLVARGDGTVVKVDSAGNVLAVAQPGPNGSILVRDALSGKTRLVTDAATARSLQ
jgi:hypothetical protein